MTIDQKDCIAMKWACAIEKQYSSNCKFLWFFVDETKSWTADGVKKRRKKTHTKNKNYLKNQNENK